MQCDYQRDGEMLSRICKMCKYCITYYCQVEICIRMQIVECVYTCYGDDIILNYLYTYVNINCGQNLMRACIEFHRMH